MFHPWLKGLATAIGFVLSVVAFVRLAASGWSAFWDALTWVGGVGVIAFALFCLYAALWPNHEISGKQRIVFGAAAVAVPAATFALLSRGDRSGFTAFGATLVAVSCIWVYVVYDWKRERRRRSIKTCPDCAEDVKVVARVCRYCGFRFPEGGAAPES